jgi:hypothetical protein
MPWIWERFRGIGGNRSDQADENEESGQEDAGAAEEKYLSDSGYGAGLAAGDAAGVARADLDEFKKPRGY